MLLNSLTERTYQWQKINKQETKRGSYWEVASGALCPVQPNSSLKGASGNLKPGDTKQTSGGEKGDPTGSLLDVKGQECRYEDQGIAKGRRDRKDWKTEREPLPFQTLHLRVSIYSGTNLQASRKGQWGREHPVHCPLEWSSPETSPLYISCGPAAQRWDSHPRINQHIEICHFTEFPTGLLLAAGK